MKLSKKTIFYSITLGVIMTTLFILYMVIMFPGLYVKHIKDNNIEVSKELHMRFVEEKSYKNLNSDNIRRTISVIIPKKGNYVEIYGKGYSGKLNIKDSELKKLYVSIKGIISKTKDGRANEQDDFKDFERTIEIWTKQFFKEKIELEMQIDENEFINMQKNIAYDTNARKIAENSWIIEQTYKDKDNLYSSIIGFSDLKNSYIITMIPVVNPSINQVLPVVFSSLPMVASIVFLIMILASKLFSDRIVNPIEKLASHADSMRKREILEMEPIEIVGRDEISQLGMRLNELYTQLSENYRQLSLEKERQEVFLRASSHQLKTPITAALLLSEGMIYKVGKYKDTDKYMPELKKQILNMQKTVEDILSMNLATERLERSEIGIRDLVEEIIVKHSVLFSEKKLSVDIHGKLTVCTNIIILYKIIDNLISNAINYSEMDSKIVIYIEKDRFKIINYGKNIPEEILRNIFEPFVSGNNGEHNGGLGLYLSRYYSKILDYEININNIENGVLAELIF